VDTDADLDANTKGICKNAEYQQCVFWRLVFCGIQMQNDSAFYTLAHFRIPQFDWNQWKDYAIGTLHTAL